MDVPFTVHVIKLELSLWVLLIIVLRILTDPGLHFINTSYIFQFSIQFSFNFNFYIPLKRKLAPVSKLVFLPNTYLQINPQSIYMCFFSSDD